MEKKLKGITLLLFSICCAVGFSMGVNAEVLDMSEDMTKADVQEAINSATDELTINGNGHSIIGKIAVNNGIDITINNVTIDGLTNPEVEVEEDRNFDDNLLSLNLAGKVVIEDVTFINYSGKGIYVDSVESLDVTNSTFDASSTKYIGDNDYTGNPEADLIYRSASGIDINLGNTQSGVTVDHITISGNTFKNVVVVEDQSTSTAGAIKIKVKDAANVTSVGTIRIEENTFENNERDLVIGTNDPASGTLASETADVEVLLVNNNTMKVGNFSTSSRLEEVLNGNYKLNYADAKKYELDENLYYMVNDENYATFEDVVEGVMTDDDIKGISFDIDGVSFSIAKETFADENLGEALDKLSNITLEEETTIEALKQYQGEGVFFVDIAGLEIFDDGIHYQANLGEEYSGQVFVYYYDEANGLQLVSNPNAENGEVEFSFTKNGTYVVSETNLIPSSSSEVPSEDVPEVPQTFDSLGIYAGIGLVSVAGIAGAVIYLKRRNA